MLNARRNVHVAPAAVADRIVDNKILRLIFGWRQYQIDKDCKYFSDSRIYNWGKRR